MKYISVFNIITQYIIGCKKLVRFGNRLGEAAESICRLAFGKEGFEFVKIGIPNLEDSMRTVRLKRSFEIC